MPVGLGCGDGILLRPTITLLKMRLIARLNFARFQIAIVGTGFAVCPIPNTCSRLNLVTRETSVVAVQHPLVLSLASVDVTSDVIMSLSTASAPNVTPALNRSVSTVEKTASSA